MSETNGIRLSRYSWRWRGLRCRAAGDAAPAGARMTTMRRELMASGEVMPLADRWPGLNLKACASWRQTSNANMVGWCTSSNCRSDRAGSIDKRYFDATSGVAGRAPGGLIIAPAAGLRTTRTLPPSSRADLGGARDSLSTSVSNGH